MSFWIRFLLVFVSAAVVDWIWAEYIIATSNKQALSAAVYGGVIFLIGAYITMSYVDTPELLVAGALGGFIGTYGCVKYRQ